MTKATWEQVACADGIKRWKKVSKIKKGDRVRWTRFDTEEALTIFEQYPIRYFEHIRQVGTVLTSKGEYLNVGFAKGAVIPLLARWVDKVEEGDTDNG
jgi:hypothetical protein